MKIIIMFFSSALLLFGCNEIDDFEKDCTKCSSINKHDFGILIQQLMDGNETYQEKITDSAFEELLDVKDVLSNGHKVNACGCRNEELRMQIYGTRENDTYEFALELMDDGEYIITNVEWVSFLHP